jgi:hypothetical protein
MQKVETALRRKTVRAMAAVGICALALVGCSKGNDPSIIGTFRMGEKVQAGPLVYSVLESEWKAALTEGGRAPSHRFLFLRLSITNLAGQPVAIPGLELRGAKGETYPEVTTGMEDVRDWLGLLRSFQPGQTQSGWIVFDAPMGAYKLAVSDGGDVDTEKHALIDIPVHLD